MESAMRLEDWKLEWKSKNAKQACFSVSRGTDQSEQAARNFKNDMM
ncbi:hypothetical protein SAMN05444321_1225 [Bradyrhizobium lablabi]|nr:hypothetical protein SAMN05444321_1225 [Bradyrhizobium lablabi]